MPNRYLNLDGTRRVSETYDQISTGFDKVQQDMDAGVTESQAIQADITNHKNSETAHSADHITYTGDVAGANNVKQAVDTVKTALDQAIIAGDSGPEAAAARASISGETYPTLGDRLDTEYVEVTSQLAETVTGVYNVKTGYGAKGDRVTDDTAAVQAACDAIPMGGRGVLYFPSGGYIFTGNINIADKHIELVGAGQSLTDLIWTADGGIIYSGGAGYSLNVRNLNFQTSLDGVSTAIVASWTVAQPTFRIDECAFRGSDIGLYAWKKAITLFNSKDTHISKCFFLGNNLTSMVSGVEYTADRNATGHYVTECLFQNMDTGLRVTTSTHPGIEGFQLNKTGFVNVNFGIDLDASTAPYSPPTVHIRSCHFDVHLKAINSNKFSQLIITNNSFYAGTGVASLIEIKDCSTLIVNENEFIDAASTNCTGVNISGTSDFGTISDNVFSLGTTSTGIWLQSNTTQIKVRDNVYPDTIAHRVLDQSLTNDSVVSRVALVRMVENQVVVSGPDSILAWASAVRNDNAMWNVDNPTRLTVPAGVKRVRVSGNMRFGANATGSRYAYFERNGAGNTYGLPLVRAAGHASDLDINISSTVIDVSAGDYFEFKVAQDSGASLNVVASVTTWFSMEVIE